MDNQTLRCTSFRSGDTDILVCKIIGQYEHKGFVDILDKIVANITNYQNNKVLIDISEMKEIVEKSIISDTKKRLKIAVEIEQRFVALNKLRIAIHIRKEDCNSIIKNQLQMKGIGITIFHNYETAIAWLDQ